MELFYRLNPKKMMRYQPFMTELFKQNALDTDSIAWRQGIYVQMAIGSVLPKGKRYPTQPSLMDRFDVDEDGEIHEISDADRFWAWAQSMNQNQEIKAIEEKIAAERKELEAAKSDQSDITDGTHADQSENVESDDDTQ